VIERYAIIDVCNVKLSVARRIIDLLVVYVVCTTIDYVGMVVCRTLESYPNMNG
jgi:hypothetical protein